ncbi:MAG: glycosyltransferase family 9 protein [Burkholderiales bacterium]
MRIAILRALRLGDLLCAVPALRAFDTAWPDARITFIGLPWARQFAARFRHYIDAFVEFPGFPGMAERNVDAAALPGFFETARTLRFDLVLQMHGSGEITNPLAILLGAGRAAGFYRPGRFCPDPNRYLEWRDDEQEVLRWLRLAGRLGAPDCGTHLEFPFCDGDFREWRAFDLRHYAVLHPGSQLASRRWPAERFAQVGDALAQEGMRVVITGTAAEAGLARRVKDAMRQPALDLAGRTTLGGLAALISRARLLVANDTGVSHIAAATRTPSVIIACGSDPRRWAPLDRQLHRVLYEPIECRPCGYADCPIGHPCASAVSAKTVIDTCVRAFSCAA